MIRSDFERLRRRKSYEENRTLTIRTMAEETGLAKDTLQKIKANHPARFDATTIDALCRYFNCTVGDLLVYEPDQSE